MLATAPPVITQVSWSGEKLGTRDHEGEALGLCYVDRLPEACPSGYYVGLVHRGAAYVIALRGESTDRPRAAVRRVPRQRLPQAAEVQ